MCQSHTGRLTGFRFLLKNPPKGWILMNESSIIGRYTTYWISESTVSNWRKSRPTADVYAVLNYTSYSKKKREKSWDFRSRKTYLNIYTPAVGSRFSYNGFQNKYHLWNTPGSIFDTHVAIFAPFLPTTISLACNTQKVNALKADHFYLATPHPPQPALFPQ